ncbi:MAG: hypothetical protein R3E08_10545 [Thiotrichaceae bacterium]
MKQNIQLPFQPFLSQNIPWRFNIRVDSLLKVGAMAFTTGSVFSILSFEFQISNTSTSAKILKEQTLVFHYRLAGFGADITLNHGQFRWRQPQIRPVLGRNFRHWSTAL